MNKRDLTREVATLCGMQLNTVASVIDATIKTFEKQLNNGEKIKLIGFGTFEKVARRQRVGRNPRNPGENIIIPQRYSVSFKPGKKLKETLNSK